MDFVIVLMTIKPKCLRKYLLYYEVPSMPCGITTSDLKIPDR